VVNANGFVSPCPRSQSQVHHLRRIGLSLDLSAGTSAESLKELQAEFNLTYMFISHDLSVVKFISDRILVMNRGQIVEEGSSESIYREPQQQYTRQLIASIPSLERIQQRQQALKLSAS